MQEEFVSALRNNGCWGDYGQLWLDSEAEAQGLVILQLTATLYAQKL